MAMFERFWGDKANPQSPDLILKRLQIPTSSGSVEVDRPLKDDEDYVTCMVRRLRVVYSRKGTHKYYGCVHSHVKLIDARGGDATFQTVTTPPGLKGVAPSDLARVLTLDLPFLEAVPYRGGLDVELGLMTVESEGSDLVAPYLGLLEEVAKKAGVGIAQQALSFVQPIQKGLDLLMGGGRKLELEVGITSRFTTTGSWLLMRAPKAIELCLEVNPSLEPVDAQGALIMGYPYVIFTVAASDKRPRYMDIPEIKKSHDALIEALLKGQYTEVEKTLFPYFRRVCLLSPDLIMSHACKLVEMVEARIAKILKAKGTGRSGDDLWVLDDLDPFE